MVVWNFTYGLRRFGGLILALAALVLWVAMASRPALAAPEIDTLPVLWEAGGLSAGNDGAGQAARVAVDSTGNLAIVSGPAQAANLAVTSYTPDGVFRWQSSITPAAGIFLADWVAAAPGGDFVAVGHTISTSTGNPIAISLVRFDSDGGFQWRVDLPDTLPSVGRLLVDSAGSAYLAYNGLGDGQDIRLRKYDAAGVFQWSAEISTGLLSNNYATSLAFSPDESEIALVGDTLGGAEWITALYDTATGSRKWLVTAPEGTAALDVLVNQDRVYVTGQGNVGIQTYLSVVAYDRTDGTRLWRQDHRPVDGTGAAGLRMAFSPDGSLVVAGRATRGFLDWYTVALEADGTFRWEAVRDGGLNQDEVPAGVLVLPDGVAVVTGKGGPNLPGGYVPGVTAGYSASGEPLWEAFSRLATTWEAALPNGDVCAVGGYDALITCWRPPGSPVGYQIWVPVLFREP